MKFDPADYEIDEGLAEPFDRPKQRAGMVVSVRLDAAETDRLLGFADETERTVSQVARLAIRKFLDGATMPTLAASRVTVQFTSPLAIFGGASAQSFGYPLSAKPVTPAVPTAAGLPS